MKKFKFKLEVVLVERKRIEDMRLREWTLAQRFLQELHKQLEQLNSRLALALDESTELNSKNDLSMISTMDSFINGMKVRIGWKHLEVQKAQKIYERKRVDYIQASQKRKSLEKLKEHRYLQFKERIHKDELKILDDIYIMNGAARRRMDSEDAPTADSYVIEDALTADSIKDTEQLE